MGRGGGMLEGGEGIKNDGGGEGVKMGVWGEENGRGWGNGRLRRFGLGKGIKDRELFVGWGRFWLMGGGKMGEDIEGVRKVFGVGEGMIKGVRVLGG